MTGLVALCVLVAGVMAGVSPPEGMPVWSAGYFANWGGTAPHHEDIYNFFSGGACWGYGFAAGFAFGPVVAGAFGGSCWLITYA